MLERSDGEAEPIDRRLVARRLADAYVRQVFDLGQFHADPHPGNILVEPVARVGLIDFGQVGTITDELMTQLIVIVYACVNNELDVVIDTLADMGAVGRETDRGSLHRALQALLDKYHGLPIKRFDLPTVLAEFTDVVRRHDVLIPRDLMMLFKAIGTVSGVVIRLDADLDMLELLQPRLKEALSKRFSPARLARAAALVGWDMVSIARQAPRYLRQMMCRVSAGTWRLDIRHQEYRPVDPRAGSLQQPACLFDRYRSHHRGQLRRHQRRQRFDFVRDPGAALRGCRLSDRRDTRLGVELGHSPKRTAALTTAWNTSSTKMPRRMCHPGHHDGGRGRGWSPRFRGVRLGGARVRARALISPYQAQAGTRHDD